MADRTRLAAAGLFLALALAAVPALLPVRLAGVGIIHRAEAVRPLVHLRRGPLTAPLASQPELVPEGVLQVAISQVAPRSHTVAPGETLWRISSDTGISVQALAAANHLTLGTTLHPGQVLTVPPLDPASPQPPQLTHEVGGGNALGHFARLWRPRGGAGGWQSPLAGCGAASRPDARDSCPGGCGPLAVDRAGAYPSAGPRRDRRSGRVRVSVVGRGCALAGPANRGVDHVAVWLADASDLRHSRVSHRPRYRQSHRYADPGCGKRRCPICWLDERVRPPHHRRSRERSRNQLLSPIVDSGRSRPAGRAGRRAGPYGQHRLEHRFASPLRGPAEWGAARSDPVPAGTERDPGSGCGSGSRDRKAHAPAGSPAFDEARACLGSGGRSRAGCRGRARGRAAVVH